MDMQYRNAPSSPVDEKHADSLYVPLSVHGAWVRVALWVDTANSTDVAGIGAGQIRLQVYATVGGHDEIKYLEQNGQLPYAYNAFDV
jgi:hypothetical protein